MSDVLLPTDSSVNRMMSGWRSLVVMRCQEERADELLSKFEHTR